MCKWFFDLFRPDPVIPVIGNRIAYHFAIDDYPGTSNDLPDCVIDQNNFVNFLRNNYPEFQIKTFKNSVVTRDNFRIFNTEQIKALRPGDKFILGYSGHGTKGVDPIGKESDGYSEALYLRDGPFWDREFSDMLDLIPFGAEVIIPLDSCYAQGSTIIRYLNPRKTRFMPIQELNPLIGMKRSQLRNNMNNYAVLAACQENQTSSSTGSGGVFTLHLIEAWQRSLTYSGWVDETVELLKEDNEKQIPNIEGDPNIINKVILT